MKKVLGFFSSSSAATDAAALQESFRSHYRSFRSLLTANNNALELMAEMDQILAQGQTFGMAFVRGHSTALTVNVYKMIQDLQDLSGGRYAALLPPFQRISGQMESILARQPRIPEGKVVMPLTEISMDDADLVGDKMANLGEVMNRVGLRVPPGFVITAAAAQEFMGQSGLQNEINRLLKSLDMDDLESLYTISAQIQRLISGAPLPQDLEGQILGMYEELLGGKGDKPLVSMRSSAVGEDLRSVSFAGQYRTQLNIGEESLLQTYKEIVASKYRSQAIVYRHQRGFRHQDVTMCVGCMAMVDAVASGVIFSRSPRNPHSSWVEINAAPGLAGQVVAGSVKTDFYKVGREGPHEIFDRRPGDSKPVLTDVQLQELARIATRLERHFGAPQDIEWSIEAGGEIFILQSRAIAQPLEAEADTAVPKEEACGEGALMWGGLTASPGAAGGPVHIVRSDVDLLEFPQGAVLVVEDPRPEWASLLNRAVAVVSEKGHAATHLAIVAREFGLPALFGAEGATRELANGMVVTVDATGRCVYPERNEEILARAAPPANLMANSPVYKLLEEIKTLVSPLNLTDPGSPFFRPSECKTLHDITRFCHEKAVTEMFSFGEKAGFDAKSAKQLVGEMPYKWWVIDLEDGFREGFDTREKYIPVDDIVSEPMLALWEGMTAKPWPGPPPVSVRGLGSIIFRSTRNPSLEPEVRGSLAAKNYFLISRNFCNLSMRLGYHFALVEAYVGSLLTENYVSFQFKGGAADRSRRFIRVFLLQEILERYGFRVVVKHDALTARIEKKPREYLDERLRVLGYLLIHTRQIDMVMGEKIMVDRYRRQIMEDLGQIAAVD